MDIGQTIKRLRRERNFTQEELAEQLNVTPQAVSRWENGTGLPDISQIVPLSSVFGVSTDVLFGTFGVTGDEEVAKIIETANAMEADDGLADPEDVGYYLRGYEYLLDALKKYPNNMKLLREALGWSVNRALLFHWKNDPRAAELYAEAEREANLMISYGDLSDKLDGHQWLVKMYPEFGEFEKAEPHAAAFPDSIFGGFNLNRGYAAAMLRQQAGDHEGAIKQLCENVFSILNILEGQLKNLGTEYMWTKRYEDAIIAHKATLRLLDLVYDGAAYTPTHLQSQMTHASIAMCYLQLGDEDAAYEWLDKMVEYHTAQEPLYNAREKPTSPLVREQDFSFPEFFGAYDAKGKLLRELDSPRFKDIRGTPRFRALLERVNAL